MVLRSVSRTRRDWLFKPVFVRWFSASNETIEVRGDSPVEIETVATHHGPVVAGEPRHGHAIACAYTAIAEANATFDTFVPMLRAQSAHELEAAMRARIEARYY